MKKKITILLLLIGILASSYGVMYSKRKTIERYVYGELLWNDFFGIFPYSISRIAEKKISEDYKDKIGDKKFLADFISNYIHVHMDTFKKKADFVNSGDMLLYGSAYCNNLVDFYLKVMEYQDLETYEIYLYNNEKVSVHTVASINPNNLKISSNEDSYEKLPIVDPYGGVTYKDENNNYISAAEICKRKDTKFSEFKGRGGAYDPLYYCIMTEIQFKNKIRSNYGAIDSFIVKYLDKKSTTELKELLYKMIDFNTTLGKSESEKIFFKGRIDYLFFDNKEALEKFSNVMVATNKSNKYDFAVWWHGKISR